MSAPTPPVLTLDGSAIDAVVAVLVDAFRDYPAMRFVLGPDNPRYDDELRRLVRFFVMARVERGETILGIAGESGSAERAGKAGTTGASPSLSAVALVSYPGRRSGTPALDVARSELWKALGPGPRERYQAFSEAAGGFDVGVPHVHLNMIGVHGSARGAGLGGRLMDAVHDVSARDAGSRGVTLTTEDPRNVPFYERYGYEVVGHVRVSPELETWGFFREDA